MNKRKSIAISNKAYDILRQHCPSCNASPMLSEIVEKVNIEPTLAETPKHQYASKGKRKLLQISYEAWKRLKKFEYSFIFEADRDDIPLNDIASLVVVQYYQGAKPIQHPDASISDIPA